MKDESIVPLRDYLLSNSVASFLAVVLILRYIDISKDQPIHPASFLRWEFDAVTPTLWAFIILFLVLSIFLAISAFIPRLRHLGILALKPFSLALGLSVVTSFIIEWILGFQILNETNQSFRTLGEPLFYVGFTLFLFYVVNLVISPWVSKSASPSEGEQPKNGVITTSELNLKSMVMIFVIYIMLMIFCRRTR